MIEVYNNLFVGNDSNCFYENKDDWVIIHACKHPCHQRAVGYKGNLNGSHPNYLVLEKEGHLFLNMVDMNTPLSHKFTEPIILAALAFIEKNIGLRKVLIHCNVGQSRSPTLALLFLSKRKKVISDENYQEAKKEFIKIFPLYQPGRGIEIYLTRCWDMIK